MSARSGVVRTPAITAAALCLLLAAGTPTARAQGPVYRNAFGDAQATGWSAQRLFSPRIGVSMLGRFHNEQAVLTLNKLAPHAGVVVAFDLHVIGAWTGERPGSSTGFSVTLDDAVLLNSSLATDDGDANNPRRQSFPEEPGAAAHPAALGAYKLNTLGVREHGATQPDAVYRLVFASPHSGDALRIALTAAGLPGDLSNASWAVDNVVVYTVGSTGDLDRARAAARDAVTQLDLGLAGNPTVAPAPAAPERVPDSFTPSISGAFGAFEASSARTRRDDAPTSILSEAMAAQRRIDLVDTGDTQLAVASGREAAGLSAFRAAASAIPAVPAIAARIEQPVIRRVSTQVYQERFGQGVGKEWDPPSHGVAPRGERFAGPYGNQSVSLSLDSLPDHDQLIVEADLYTIGDWQGDGPDPSKMTVSLDGHVLLNESFATEDGRLTRTQSYPGGARRQRMPGADAAAVDSLGYSPVGDAKSGAAGDAVYHLRFVVPHDGSTGALSFAASGLPKSGASWGVDNVTIVAAGDRSMRFADVAGEEPDDNANDGSYNNPFVRAPGPEWNVQELEKSPSGEMFLGRLHNQTASLTVRNFPQHTHLVIGADVMVMGDWQGNAPEPSQFIITLADGTQVCATTFATDGGEVDATQNYPDIGPSRNLPGAGAMSVGTLGYGSDSKWPRDAVYRLLFTLPHGTSQETISFTVKGLRGDKKNASWGLDNVIVSSFDAAGGGGGGGTALGDAGALAWSGSSGGGFGGSGARMNDNPFIPSTPSEPFPHVGDGGGGGGGGGGGTTPENHTTPTTPAPGTIPAMLVGLGIASRRRRP